MKLIDLKKFVLSYTKKKSFKYGLPFILFVVMGSFGFERVAEIRYKYRNAESFRDKAIAEGHELKSPDKITLEAEHEKLKAMNLDEWENVRIERPWEK